MKIYRIVSHRIVMHRSGVRPSVCPIFFPALIGTRPIIDVNHEGRHATKSEYMFRRVSLLREWRYWATVFHCIQLSGPETRRSSPAHAQL